MYYFRTISSHSFLTFPHQKIKLKLNNVITLRVNTRVDEQNFISSFANTGKLYPKKVQNWFLRLHIIQIHKLRLARYWWVFSGTIKPVHSNVWNTYNNTLHLISILVLVLHHYAQIKHRVNYYLWTIPIRLVWKYVTVIYVFQTLYFLENLILWTQIVVSNYFHCLCPYFIL